jgi:hypothetical protein
MIKLKSSIAVALFATMFASFAATANIIDVYLHAEEGGNLHTQTVMLKDSLENAGYQVNLLPLGSCHSMQDYRDSAENPGIFLYQDVFHLENLLTDCDVGLDESTFVVPVYNRLNAFCSRAGTSTEEVVDLLHNDSPFTVASSTSAPPHLFTRLGESLGKTVTMVPYSGTSGSLRGLLGGDADIWFGGLTSRIVENQELFCWANSGAETIGTMVPMTALFENYQYSELNSYWFVVGHNVQDEFAESLLQDLNQIFNNDAQWQEYITNGYLVRDSSVESLTITEILENINNWK